MLVVSHEASATGAVHSLLGLMQWLDAESSLKLQTLCLHGGAKLDSFAKFGPVEVLKPSARESIEEILSDVDLVLVNSAASAGALPALATLGCPVIAWVHELEYEISLLDRESREALATVPVHYVACSEAVASNLQNQLGIATDAITTIGEIVSIEDILARSGAEDAAPLHKQLGVDQEVKLIGAMGTPSWRKGVDLFLASAAAYLGNESFPKAHFVWIGGNETPDERSRIDFEVKRLGLSEHVTFTGALDNPFPCLKALDVFCLTSREDPYPLVMIEAKILNLPVVGFAGSGGFEEFARDFGARVVPPGTPGALADGIAAELASSAPRSAGQDLSALDVSALGPRFLEVIQRFRGPADGSGRDVRAAAGKLVQQYYPIGIRVINKGRRLEEYSLDCPLDEDWTLRCELPQQAEGNRMRFAFSSGPAGVDVTSVRIVSVDGAVRNIDFDGVCKTSGSVISHDSRLYMTGHHSHLHLDLPTDASGVLEMDLKIRRMDGEMLAAVAKEVSAKQSR